MTRHLMERYQLPSTAIRQISWGVDLELFRPATRGERVKLRRALNVPDNAFLIFSNRATAPVYRTDRIIRAFSFAKRERTNLYLIVLEGHGHQASASFRRSVHDLASRAGEWVRWLPGTIASSEMREYLQAADCVISIPSSDQRSTSVLEALACCPRVCLSGIPAYGQLRRDGFGFIEADCGDDNHVALAMLTAAQTQDEEAAAAHADNYEQLRRCEDWNVQALKVEDLYRELLEHADTRASQ